jgi:hypothetical protein
VSAWRDLPKAELTKARGKRFEIGNLELYLGFVG